MSAALPAGGVEVNGAARGPTVGGQKGTVGSGRYSASCPSWVELVELT